MWGKWLYGIRPWSISCPVKEGGNGVDFRPESRLVTLRDVKQENYVKCIKHKSLLYFKLQQFDIILYVNIYGAIFASSNLLLRETI